MRRGRWYGAGLVLGSLVLIPLGWVVGDIGIELGEAALVTGTTFAASGLMLLLAPGPDGAAGVDFTEWFESLPTRDRIRVFAAAGLGFATGLALAAREFLSELLHS